MGGRRRPAALDGDLRHPIAHDPRGFCCARSFAWRAAISLRSEPSPAAEISAIYARAFTFLTVVMAAVVVAWADLVDRVTLDPELRRRYVRLLGELEASP